MLAPALLVCLSLSSALSRPALQILSMSGCGFRASSSLLALPYSEFCHYARCSRITIHRWLARRRGVACRQRWACAPQPHLLPRLYLHYIASLYALLLNKRVFALAPTATAHRVLASLCSCNASLVFLNRCAATCGSPCDALPAFSPIPACLILPPPSLLFFAFSVPGARALPLPFSSPYHAFDNVRRLLLPFATCSSLILPP